MNDSEFRMCFKKKGRSGANPEPPRFATYDGRLIYVIAQRSVSYDTNRWSGVLTVSFFHVDIKCSSYRHQARSA